MRTGFTESSHSEVCNFVPCSHWWRCWHHPLSLLLAKEGPCNRSVTLSVCRWHHFFHGLHAMFHMSTDVHAFGSASPIVHFTTSHTRPRGQSCQPLFNSRTRSFATSVHFSTWSFDVFERKHLFLWNEARFPRSIGFYCTLSCCVCTFGASVYSVKPLLSEVMRNFFGNCYSFVGCICNFSLDITNFKFFFCFLCAMKKMMW